MSQRALQMSARRLALGQPSTSLALSRFAVPASSLIIRRTVAASAPKTNSMTQSEGMTILENQRLHRPSSPHMTIYKPQMTWILSIMNRITGAVLSGGFYVFGAAYLAAPLFGWQITSAAMVAGFAKWPLILKLLAKMTVALPFTFHSFNGIRHLMWDLGMQMTNQQVITTGWTVLGLTVASALGLAFI